MNTTNRVFRLLIKVRYCLTADGNLMKVVLLLSVILNLYLFYFIGKRFYYHKVPPVLWSYDIAMLGDSHVYRGKWNELLNCRVANFGKGNSTVQDMQSRLPGVITCKPKICFVHGGINDINSGVAEDTTLKYYTLIIEDLKRAGIKPVIIGVMHPIDTVYHSAVDRLNRKLRPLAHYIEIDIIADDLSEDGLHMDGTGYSKWGAAIKKYI